MYLRVNSGNENSASAARRGEAWPWSLRAVVQAFRARVTTPFGVGIATEVGRRYDCSRCPSYPGLNHAATRLTAGFEYVGPPLPGCLARLLLSR